MNMKHYPNASSKVKKVLISTSFATKLRENSVHVTYCFITRDNHVFEFPRTEEGFLLTSSKLHRFSTCHDLPYKKPVNELLVPKSLGLCVKTNKHTNSPTNKQTKTKKLRDEAMDRNSYL